MNKVFTKEFYLKIYKELHDYCEENYDGEEVMTVWIDDIEINGHYYEIDCEVDIEREFHDESFDHAFGVWHDPFPYYEFVDVDGISDVEVYEDGNKIEGFSVEDYYNFVNNDEDHEGFHTGDKVMIGKSLAEVRYYNHRNDVFRVKYENGRKDDFVWHRQLKKVAGIYSGLM